MRSGKWVGIVVTGCVLMNFTGCGAAPQSRDESAPSDYVEASVSPDGSAEAAAGNPGCISIAEAKEVVPGNAGQQYIDSEAAKQAALSHCGLDEKDVSFGHAHLERDDGKWIYDVEFYKDNAEYDYDIDALTGEVLSFDHDSEHHHHQAANPPGTGDGLITEDSAKQIALEYGGVTETEAQYLEVELDYDDGRAEYEVEWYVGRTEYSCSVDAVTGEVLSFEKEID